MLKTILTSLDNPLSASFQHDDVSGWPDGARSVLEGTGILKRGGNAQSITCDGCGEGCLEDVVFSTDHGGGLAAYVVCRERDDIGRVRVAPERLRTWVVSLGGLAARLAAELGGHSAPEECVAGRLWWLGRLSVNGCRVETFVACGARWNDAKNVFARCDRLRECLAPLVLVPDKTGQRQLFGEFAVVASLTRILHLEDVPVLDCSAIQFGDAAQSPDLDRVFRHSPDFRSVCLRGKEFGLTTNQARVVQCLHAARVNSAPDIGQAYLLEEVLETGQERLKDVFRGLSGWDQLIIPGKTKGTFRLNF